MPKITLPDGAVKNYDSSITGLQIAQDISNSLAKKALAISIRQNDSSDSADLWDLSREIQNDSHVSIITPDTDEGLEIIRHDTAHLMAAAVQALYPDAQVTIGPVIENGFFYDFARDEPFHPDDLVKIEQKMHEIAARDDEIIREEWERDDAIAFFTDKQEPYKVELIRDIPEGEKITFYRHKGEKTDFIDLCRGPHAPHTRHLKHFKLMKIAGAYWRGDSKNAMLQRIYGTAWASEKELKAYLTQLEEAEKRDHRKLGKEMELFHIQEEAAGMVFWHPKGWTLYRMLENYIRAKQQKYGYREVKTPQMMDRILWERSGHWDKFRENMFIAESENRLLALKPMSCPGHVQIYNSNLVSYKELPIKIAEFGLVHRNEPSGSLHGLMRARGFTQDDGHVFCMPEQVTEQTIEFCNSVQEVYTQLGFEKIKIKFSDRPEKRAGSDDIWDKAEAALLAATKETGLEYTLNPGEGAFYGPKLEFVLTDAIGRDWQCGTLQVDFVLPERLDANYIGRDGAKHRPVFLHRAILGSFERFIGILIEQYAGKFPLWLAPEQVVVATITNSVNDYAVAITEKMRNNGIKVKLDDSSEKINYKVRLHSNAKIPIICAVGAREAEENTVAVRRLGSKEQKVIKFDEFLENLIDETKIPS